MADGEESIVNHACDTNGKLTVKTGVSCQHCDELNAELHKVYVELLSYEKVVSVLQEEIRNLECCRNYNDMYQDIHSKPQTHEIEMDNNWNQVKVRHNKSSKSNNSNLIQLIPCSSNKYEILHNLEENNEIVSSVSNRRVNGSICETQTKAMKNRFKKKLLYRNMKL